MRIGLVLLLILWLGFLSQNAASPQDDTPAAVVSFKWTPMRQTKPTKEAPNISPPPEMTPGNKSAGRAARVNNPLIPDPNEQTIDGRSAAIDKIVQQARTGTPRVADGFIYQARIQNKAKQNIEIVFWEYQFIDPANPGSVTRRQFLCGVKIKAAKESELKVFSLLGPSDVINAATAGNQTQSQLQEKAVVNRLEFSDGSIWQRRDWNFAEIRATYKRAIETPWESEMCRGL